MELPTFERLTATLRDVCVPPSYEALEESSDLECGSALEVPSSATEQEAHAPCTGCGKPWEWPKNAIHQQVGCLPIDVRPSTKALLVSHVSPMPGTRTPSICLESIQRLQFATQCDDSTYDALRHRLVMQYAYNTKTGDVIYDTGAAERPGYAYAQLITINSWWIMLFRCVATVAIGCLSLQADASLICFIWSHDAYSYTSTRLVLTCSLISFLLMRVGLAMSDAAHDWRIKSHHKVGDIVTNCSKLDQIQAFIALVTFHFFSVQSLVKDIVIALHPHKSIQPYAAIKSEGHRAFIVGWRCEHMFKVENRQGQYLALLLASISKFASLLLKLLIIWDTLNNLNVNFIFGTVCGLPSLCNASYEWFVLHRARASLKGELEAIIACERDEMLSVKKTREIEAAKKILVQHRMRDADVDDALSSSDPENMLCVHCDRLLSERTLVFEESVAVGQAVRLCHSAGNCGDADRGPLAPGEIAVVKSIEKGSRDMRMRVCVANQKGATWWYNREALEEVVEDDPLAWHGTVESGEETPSSKVQKSVTFNEAADAAEDKDAWSGTGGLLAGCRGCCAERRSVASMPAVRL